MAHRTLLLLAGATLLVADLVFAWNQLFTRERWLGGSFSATSVALARAGLAAGLVLLVIAAAALRGSGVGSLVAGLVLPCLVVAANLPFALGHESARRFLLDRRLRGSPMAGVDRYPGRESANLRVQLADILDFARSASPAGVARAAEELLWKRLPKDGPQDGPDWASCGEPDGWDGKLDDSPSIARALAELHLQAPEATPGLPARLEAEALKLPNPERALFTLAVLTGDRPLFARACTLAQHLARERTLGDLRQRHTSAIARLRAAPGTPLSRAFLELMERAGPGGAVRLEIAASPAFGARREGATAPWDFFAGRLTSLLRSATGLDVRLLDAPAGAPVLGVTPSAVHRELRVRVTHQREGKYRTEPVRHDEYDPVLGEIVTRWKTERVREPGEVVYAEETYPVVDAEVSVPAKEGPVTAQIQGGFEPNLFDSIWDAHWGALTDGSEANVAGTNAAAEHLGARVAWVLLGGVPPVAEQP